MTTDTDPHELADLPTLRVRGPADLAQAIPYLLGFHPSRSLVLIGLEGVRVVVTARLDLADLVDPQAAGLLAGSIAAMHQGGAAKFVAVVFDDDAMPRHGGVRPLPWDGIVAEVNAAAEQVGATVDDVVLVSGQRLWSYLCDEPECCPPEGQLLEANSEVVAEATFAGLVALPDRASLAALLEPLPDPDRDRLVPLLDTAQRDAVAMIVRGDDARGDRSVVRALFAAARAARASQPAASGLADAELVRFGVALQRIPVRDSVWMAVDDRRLDGRELWLQLARRLPSPFDAPALFLFAWGAWRSGNGALAGMAAERALGSDPGYSAADLLLAALSRGIDPRRMPRLRMRKAG